MGGKQQTTSLFLCQETYQPAAGRRLNHIHATMIDTVASVSCERRRYLLLSVRSGNGPVLSEDDGRAVELVADLFYLNEWRYRLMYEQSWEGSWQARRRDLSSQTTAVC